MKHQVFTAVVLLLAITLLVHERLVDACSTLCLRSAGRIVFGKNYDWTIEDGMLVVNKRGVAHVSDTKGSHKSVPAHWKSKYGSVTFNQYGRDFPSGGMNEEGLVVELMWADGSRYPKPDSRPTVDCLEWIQYQLDTSKTVHDVIASDARVRIQSEVPLHYLIADAEGGIAAIEFVKGKLVPHTGAKLPVPALTNDLYEDAIRFLNETQWTPSDAGSRARFIRAADRVKNYKSGDPVSYVFDTLANVASAITQWSIVYEIDSRQIHFRTRSNPQIRTLTMKSLDFSCTSPVMVLDLKASVSGDIRERLQAYSKESNFKLISSSFAQTEFLAHTALTELQRLAGLPETANCRE
jgi:penicillin V acylase-like amidase (Ntn superfamily)